MKEMNPSEIFRRIKERELVECYPGCSPTLTKLLEMIVEEICVEFNRCTEEDWYDGNCP